MDEVEGWVDDGVAARTDGRQDTDADPGADDVDVEGWDDFLLFLGTK